MLLCALLFNNIANFTHVEEAVLLKLCAASLGGAFDLF